jgi:hypothetical protein
MHQVPFFGPRYEERVRQGSDVRTIVMTLLHVASATVHKCFTCTAYVPIRSYK